MLPQNSHSVVLNIIYYSSEELPNNPREYVISQVPQSTWLVISSSAERPELLQKAFVRWLPGIAHSAGSYLPWHQFTQTRCLPWPMWTTYLVLPLKRAIFCLHLPGNSLNDFSPPSPKNISARGDSQEHPAFTVMSRAMSRLNFGLTWFHVKTEIFENWYPKGSWNHFRYTKCAFKLWFVSQNSIVKYFRSSQARAPFPW